MSVTGCVSTIFMTMPPPCSSSLPSRLMVAFGPMVSTVIGRRGFALPLPALPAASCTLLMSMVSLLALASAGVAPGRSVVIQVRPPSVVCRPICVALGV